jgi:tripartite-type tricarboxylate transporter receptor subunit TctC
MDRRSWLNYSVLSALGLGELSQTHAYADSLLSGKNLKFVVGYPAGGVADFIARTCTEGVNSSTGAYVSIENKPGAAGNIAIDTVLKAGPDANVFGAFSNLQLTLNPLVPQFALKSFDPFKDLVPVAAMADLVLMLAVSTQFGVKTLDQFLAKVKDQGPNVKMGLAGIGTPHHMAALLLQKNAGLDMTLVPYKGGPPMIADAAGGHLDAVITTIPVGGPMVQAGKMNWIAVVPQTTIASLPGVPSLSSVLKGETIPTGNTIFAPAGTSQAVVAELSDTVRKLVSSPAVLAKLRANGLEPTDIPRSELPQRLRDEAAYMKEFLSKVKIDFST